MQERYFSKAISNALKILETLKGSPGALSLTQITGRSGLAKSSVFRVLRTLEAAGYVEKVSGDWYRLSPEIASAVPNRLRNQLVKVATPVARELARECRETVSVAFLLENHIEIVIVLDGPQKVQMGNEVGGIIPPHASSLGKCISANQTETRREHLLRAYGFGWFSAKTITDEVLINRELDQVRAQGFAFDIEESAPEGCCVGAPIFADDGQVFAAISVSMPTTRFRDQEKLVALVRRAAGTISEGLQTRAIS